MLPFGGRIVVVVLVLRLELVELLVEIVVLELVESETDVLELVLKLVV